MAAPKPDNDKGWGFGILGVIVLAFFLYFACGGKISR
jgi:hypothetical protein